MASVSSLDKDMRNLRMSKYTPQAANEVRRWIESTLGEQLNSGDVLDALKDGTALCKLVNLASPGSARFKTSAMPFVQMENISHFLRACQTPPLNLQSHDLFQTVDLYESKDPAQVLQCIAAFSRRAHSTMPSKFPEMIGEKTKGAFVSPQTTGPQSAASPQYGRPRASSNLSDTNSTVSSLPSQAIGGRGSPYRPPANSSINGGSPQSTGGLSSWSKKSDEGNTTPAWNIHQYGYMGGASQGNQGISFGARRQITSAAPKVPSLAEKERRRREQEAEAEAQRRREVEAEEEHVRREEERRWEEETKRQRELEKQRIEEEKKKWEEEERKWKEEEEQRAREEQAMPSQRSLDQKQQEASSDVRLTGQYLSQYKADQKRKVSAGQAASEETARIKELERQLEEARAREAQYERERQERLRSDQDRDRSRSRGAEKQSSRNESRSKSRTRSAPIAPAEPSQDPWEEDERDYSRKQWAQNQSQPAEAAPPPKPARPLPFPQPSSAEPASDNIPPPQPSRPLPTPQVSKAPMTTSEPIPPPQLTRPLPNPETYNPPSPPKSPRKSPFTRPQATPSPPPTTTPMTSTPQTSRPSPSTSTPSNPLRKPPFANPSSLLSREMELDRQRQQEWEQSQQETQKAVDAGINDGNSRPGGGAWNTSEYGYMGGDSQNRGGAGIGMGAARRQLVGGPREMPGKEKN